MVKLSDLLDVELLKNHIDNKMISVQRHPSLPLQIFNYTHKAAHESAWGDGTIDYCRGLITDLDGVVVSRGFKKFHNLNTASIPETMVENLPKVTPAVTEKFDGSLGILYQYEKEYGIATRGSFTSPQALWATAWLKERVQHNRVVLPAWGSMETWLFEIIYNANRIVLKYDFEGLVLLSILDTRTGAETHHEVTIWRGHDCGFDVTQLVRNKDIRELAAENKPNKEGYVVTYSHGPDRPPLKVKVKFEDYVRLHRIVTGMNARSVWEMCKNGTPFDSTEMPQHFQKWFASWVDRLTVEYCEIESALEIAWIHRPIYDLSVLNARQNRAAFARYVLREAPQLKSLMFLLADGKPVHGAIWDMIEPRGDDRSFRDEREEKGII